MSMKIERSTLEQVKARFAQNKKKLEEKKKDYDLEQRVKELKEEVCFSLFKIVVWMLLSLYNLLRFIIFIIRKKKSKSIEKKSEKIKRGRSKNCLKMMQDLPTKWLRSWDSPALAQKRSDKLLLWNIYLKKILFLEEDYNRYDSKISGNERDE